MSAESAIDVKYLRCKPQLCNFFLGSSVSNGRYPKAMSAVSEYLEYWKRWKDDGGRRLHPDDREFIDQLKNAKHEKAIKSSKATRPFEAPETDWNSYLAGGTFYPEENHRSMLRLGLIPSPHLGDLNNARLFVCNLNPGFTHQNYHSELDPAFSEAMRLNLRGEVKGRFPFICLDPQFSWYCGHNWWFKKLQRILETV